MDFHSLVSKCQVHKHTHTCWKFIKKHLPCPEDCRFNLSESNHNETSCFDNETAEHHPKISDGMVNNFCKTIICAICCNMDIKFIGSRPSAKAVLYYIPN